MIYVPDAADIDKLCQIAQIPEASRETFASDFNDAVNAAIKAGEDYRTPPGFVPIMVANGRAVADAALNLINALEDCDPNATRFMNGLLSEGTLDEHVQSVRNLFVVANQLARAFQNSDGKVRGGKGRPPKEIGEPGLGAGDIFAAAVFFDCR